MKTRHTSYEPVFINGILTTDQEKLRLHYARIHEASKKAEQNFASEKQVENQTTNKMTQREIIERAAQVLTKQTAEAESVHNSLVDASEAALFKYKDEELHKLFKKIIEKAGSLKDDLAQTLKLLKGEPSNFEIKQVKASSSGLTEKEEVKLLDKMNPILQRGNKRAQMEASGASEYEVLSNTDPEELNRIELNEPERFKNLVRDYTESVKTKAMAQ